MEAPTMPKSNSLRLLVGVVATVVGATVAVAAAMGAWAWYLQMSGNVHAIEPGIAYRANTLGRTQLVEVLDGDKIRTIINLRGPAPGDQWYRDETAEAQSRGIALIDIPMQDDRQASLDTLTNLVTALRTASRPILIHCKAGADRTGLAAALFELLVMGRPADQAAAQLSFAYGHFPWLGSPTAAMDQTFWQVAVNR